MNTEYVRNSDYYNPSLRLPDENRPIGKWDRMHREYLRRYHPVRYTTLISNYG